MSQHMEALARANAVRFRRAELRTDLAAGRVAFAEVLADPACARLPVGDALLWLPRWGVRKANRALQGVCSWNVHCGRLTDRQRALLVEVTAGRLVFDVRTGEHVTPRDLRERNAARLFARTAA